MITVETIKHIQDSKRPEKIEITRYNNYSESKQDAYIDNGAYSIFGNNDIRHEVSNIRSFEAVIFAECERLDNDYGNNVNINFTSKGGHCLLDADQGKHKVIFERTKSQQWLLLEGNLNEFLNHQQLLYLLQSLKPSLVNYKPLISHYQKLRMVGKSESISNPCFSNGELGEGYTIKYKLEGNKQEEAELPMFFEAEIPYSKGSEVKYKLDIEILISLDMNNKLIFKLICPDFEQVEEKAIFDEVAIFKEHCDKAEMSGLLIIENF